jgi:hypothetical protein
MINQYRERYPAVATDALSAYGAYRSEQTLTPGKTR